MMETNTIEEKEIKVKLYTIGMISIATYIGGPLAGIYLISRNFKSLGDKIAAKNTLLIGIISTVCFFVVLMLIPEIIDKTPTLLIPTIYTVIVWSIAQHYQGKQIKEHIKKGGGKASGWKVALVTIIGFIITSILLFIVVLSFVPLTEGVPK